MTLIYTYVPTYNTTPRPQVTLQLNQFSNSRITMDFSNREKRGCKSCGG